MHLALLTILACAHTIPPLPQGAALVIPAGTGVLGAEGGAPSATPPPAVAVDSATAASAGPAAPSPVTVSATWIEYAVGTMPGRLSAARGGIRGSIPGTYSGVLLQHGDSTLLVDGGASRDFEARRRAVGGLGALLLGQASRGFTRVGHPDALPERPDAALLTHAHFDHVGGFLDVPDLPVWAPRDKFAAAMPGEAELLAARLRPIPWEDHPFLYWPRRWEPFGDEGVVVVPMHDRRAYIDVFGAPLTLAGGPEK